MRRSRPGLSGTMNATNIGLPHAEQIDGLAAIVGTRRQPTNSKTRGRCSSLIGDVSTVPRPSLCIASITSTGSVGSARQLPRSRLPLSVVLDSRPRPPKTVQSTWGSMTCGMRRSTAYPPSYRPRFTPSVPERATWGMMLLGFAGLGFAFRQSRRKVSFV